MSDLRRFTIQGFLKYNTEYQFVTERLLKILEADSFALTILPPDVDLTRHFLDMSRHSLRKYIFDTHVAFEILKEQG